MNFLDSHGLWEESPDDPGPGPGLCNVDPLLCVGFGFAYGYSGSNASQPGTSGGPGSVTVQKSYNIDIPCAKSASALMSDVERHFAWFADYTGTFDGLNTTLGPDVPGTGVTNGAVIKIPHTTLGVTVNDSVTVTDAGPSSFTFTTNPGHPLNPATISFTDQGMGNGFVGFSISISGQTANAFWSLFFAAGGSTFEDGVWNHFLDQVTADCAKKHSNGH